MKLSRLLSALLIAALLLTPVAIMEEAAEQPQAEVEEMTETAIETSAETEIDETDEIEAVEAAETVDEAVAEQEAVELVETPAFEAQVEEELPVEEIPEETEIIALEADEAAKLMEPAANEIAIDAAHFPDDAFRGYVASSFDVDGSGSLSEDERAKVEHITLSSFDMANMNGSYSLQNLTFNIAVDAHSLQGIENFPNLTGLDCPGLSLGSLDLSGNPKMYYINCLNCGLTSLVFGSQPGLKIVDCSFNPLASLDVTGCPELAALVIPSNYRHGNGFVNYSNGDGRLVCDPATSISGGTPLAYSYITARKTTIYTTVGTVLDICFSDTSAWLAKSSKPKVVKRTKINMDYYWTAKKQGTAKLTFTASKKKKYVVTVKVGAAATPAVVTPPPENAITVTKNMKYWVDVGTFHQIYLNGKTGKGFKSSNKNVAYVDQSGNIAAVGGGKTKITFKVGKKKRTLTLIVVDPTIPTAVYLDKTGTVAAKVGETQTLTAAVPEGAITEYTWKSSNKKVATVLNGVVTFKKKGKVTITCTTTRGKKKAKVTFKVSK